MFYLQYVPGTLPFVIHFSPSTLHPFILSSYPVPPSFHHIILTYIVVLSFTPTYPLTILFFKKFFLGRCPLLLRTTIFNFYKYSMDPIFPAACGAAAAAAGCYLSSAAPLHFCCCYSAPVALLLLMPLLQL